MSCLAFSIERFKAVIERAENKMIEDNQNGVYLRDEAGALVAVVEKGSLDAQIAEIKKVRIKLSDGKLLHSSADG